MNDGDNARFLDDDDDDDDDDDFANMAIPPVLLIK